MKLRTAFGLLCVFAGLRARLTGGTFTVALPPTSVMMLELQ